MSIQEAKKNLESVVAKAKSAVALAAQEYVSALVRQSLGTAEAAETSRPGPRKAAKRKPKGQPRKVEKAAARVAPKVTAPETKGPRKRTSAADIATHKETVLAACVRTAKTLPSFKKADVESKVDGDDIDVGRMLSLLCVDYMLVKTGEKRQTTYRLSGRAKPNGAVEHVVVRDAEPIGGEG